MSCFTTNGGREGRCTRSNMRISGMTAPEATIFRGPAPRSMTDVAHPSSWNGRSPTQSAMHDNRDEAPRINVLDLISSEHFPLISQVERGARNCSVFRDAVFQINQSKSSRQRANPCTSRQGANQDRTYWSDWWSTGFLAGPADWNPSRGLETQSRTHACSCRVLLVVLAGDVHPSGCLFPSTQEQAAGKDVPVHPINDREANL